MVFPRTAFLWLETLRQSEILNRLGVRIGKIIGHIIVFYSKILNQNCIELAYYSSIRCEIGVCRFVEESKMEKSEGGGEHKLPLSDGAREILAVHSPPLPGVPAGSQQQVPWQVDGSRVGL